MITIQAGRVLCWATCLVPVDAIEQLLLSMRHLGSIRLAAFGSEHRQGRSVWIGSFAGHPIGLSWCWGEVRQGVVALADPLAIESNIGFVGSAGNALADRERMLHLNGLVHALDWHGPADRAPCVRGEALDDVTLEALAA